MKSPRKGIFAESELTTILNSSYRSKPLKRGFCDALFLAEMVNIADLSLGVFLRQK